MDNLPSWFQFTHPGGVRPRDLKFLKRISKVSIHAPGRGATQYGSTDSSGCVCFNSRTREGCDCSRGRHPIAYGVSIHAPGRGATSLRYLLHSTKRSFNSRTREGCDHARRSGCPSSPCFNSRTREGCDVVSLLPHLGTGAFQFTHPGGVRRLSCHNWTVSR